MKETIPSELSSVLDEIRAQLAALTDRVARIERASSGAPVAAVPVNGVVEAASKAPDKPAESPKLEVPEEITEEELLAISAAIAAFLGVRAHIRQIRLISSGAWAQEGRASIQASHRLHY